MKWYYAISTWEYTFAAAFATAYLLYLIRVIVAAHGLGTFKGLVIVKLLLRSCYFSLILVALLGPSFGESQKEVRIIGRDIMIAVDLSQSMNATDITPSRLQRVKFELLRLIETFRSDRIGLIIFSTDAFLQCPFTYDQQTLRIFIEGLNSNQVAQEGTQLTPALQLALDKHLQTEQTDLSNQAKVIILVTDGEDFGEAMMAQARKIAQSDVQLFALGIGSEQGGRIPEGRRFKTGPDGQTVVSRLNRSHLQQLSLQAAGRYFEISLGRNEVSQLIRQVSQVEGQLREKRKIDVSANKYYYFLSAALLLMVLDTLITINTIRF